MRKAGGLLVLIAGLCAFAVFWQVQHGGESSFMTPGNWKNLLTWVGLFGILSLAQSVVIITGGIDLSIGSVVGLIGITLGLWLNKGEGWSPWLAIPGALTLAGMIGLWHGVLVSKLRMQPFVVTLCGLFIYRGIARLVAHDKTAGFGTAYEGMRWFGKGTLLDLLPSAAPAEGAEPSHFATVLDLIPAPFIVLVVLAVLLGLFLHFSAQGRHLFAMGANEEAARLAGVQTARLKILAYVLCSLISGFGGLLLAFKVNSMGPSDFGSFYELYAIAGAVLGGCSLRGGQGNVVGVVLGLALIMVLRNLVNILSIPSQLEYVVIGGAILIGLGVEEFLAWRRGAPASA